MVELHYPVRIDATADGTWFGRFEQVEHVHSEKVLLLHAAPRY